MVGIESKVCHSGGSGVGRRKVWRTFTRLSAKVADHSQVWCEQPGQDIGGRISVDKAIGVGDESDAECIDVEEKRMRAAPRRSRDEK